MRYLLLVLLTLSTASFGQILNVGNTLPNIDIDKKGQVAIIDEKLVFQPWHSSIEMGKRLAFVQHIAGRVGVSDLNKSLSDAVIAQEIAIDLMDSIIIINSDDSAFGTGWLVSSETKKNKEMYPLATFINDSKGVAAKAWNIAPKTATSLIVAANGEILFSKHGATTEEDIAIVLALLQSQLPAGTMQAKVTSTIATEQEN